MLTIAVCDDEVMFAETLCAKIKKLLPDCAARTFYSGAELLKRGESFDVYFLDVQMEQPNGIETAKILREKEENGVIIFVTAVKKYVFEAFDVAAMHYLIKPVEDSKLAEILERAAREIEKRNEGEERIFIKTRERGITLKLSDIFYFENQMRKIIVHTAKEKISFYGVMAEMEKMAGERFYRCHRGYLVNLSHIVEYEKDTILLSNGERIYLAKERYPDFVKSYMHYLRDGGSFYE